MDRSESIFLLMPFLKHYVFLSDPYSCCIVLMPLVNDSNVCHSTLVAVVAIIDAEIHRALKVFSFVLGAAESTIYDFYDPSQLQLTLLVSLCMSRVGFRSLPLS